MYMAIPREQGRCGLFHDAAWLAGELCHPQARSITGKSDGGNSTRGNVSDISASNYTVSPQSDTRHQIDFKVFNIVAACMSNWLLDETPHRLHGPKCLCEDLVRVYSTNLFECFDSVSPVCLLNTLALLSRATSFFTAHQALSYSSERRSAICTDLENVTLGNAWLDLESPLEADFVCSPMTQAPFISKSRFIPSFVTLFSASLAL